MNKHFLHVKWETKKRQQKTEKMRYFHCGSQSEKAISEISHI